MRSESSERGSDSSSKMSEHFFYVDLKFIPKIVTLTVTILRQREVVVEVSKRLVQHSQSKLLNENPGEKAIALDLARRVAVDTFPTVAGRILGLYDEAAPTWHEQRHHVMNERPYDHEENGTRAWRARSRCRTLARRKPESHSEMLV